MLSAYQRCNFVKKISVTISGHVRWSSYPGPSPQPDAQIVFSWFIYMTLMKSLLWLDYSVHQGFSADVRESPEFFVFLHDLPPFSLSKPDYPATPQYQQQWALWVTQPNLGASLLFAPRHSSLPRIPSLTLSGTSSPSFCITSVQFSSVQSLSRSRLCEPVNCSTPGLPVHQGVQCEFI